MISSEKGCRGSGNRSQARPMRRASSSELMRGETPVTSRDTFRRLAVCTNTSMGSLPGTTRSSTGLPSFSAILTTWVKTSFSSAPNTCSPLSAYSLSGTTGRTVITITSLRRKLVFCSARRRCSRLFLPRTATSTEPGRACSFSGLMDGACCRFNSSICCSFRYLCLRALTRWDIVKMRKKPTVKLTP